MTYPATGARLSALYRLTERCSELVDSRAINTYRGLSTPLEAPMRSNHARPVARPLHRGAVLRAAIVLGAAALVTGCVPDPGTPIADLPLPVTEHTVVANLPGVSFAKAADVLGDGNQELIVSAFGSPLTSPGTVTIHKRGATLDDWTQIPVVTVADGIKFPNDTAVTDIDSDGMNDLVVSGGFFSCAFSGTGCGSLQWYRQSPAGVFTRHNIIEPNNSFFYHRAIPTDVNGDGIDDLVTVGETADSAVTYWFEGTAGAGDARFLATPHLIGSGGGSLPVVADVDGDGDDDVVSPQYFASGPGMIWFERTAEPSAINPAGTWVQHQFSSTDIGKGFEIELVPNLQGDGVARWIGANHQNTTFNPGIPSALWRFDDGPTPASKRPATVISTGVTARPTSPVSLAPGLFGTGDVNGDGKIDVVMSGDGDDRLFVLLQGAGGVFTTYRLASAMGQAGGAEVTDLDGDGQAEALFTSYEKGVVKLYEFGTAAT